MRDPSGIKYNSSPIFNWLYMLTHSSVLFAILSMDNDGWMDGWMDGRQSQAIFDTPDTVHDLTNFKNPAQRQI